MEYLKKIIYHKNKSKNSFNSLNPKNENLKFNIKKLIKIKYLLINSDIIFPK